MLLKKRTGLEIPSSEITPKEVYLSRRKFMAGAAALASTAALAACSPASLTRTEEAEPTAAGGRPSAPNFCANCLCYNG